MAVRHQACITGMPLAVLVNLKTVTPIRPGSASISEGVPYRDDLPLCFAFIAFRVKPTHSLHTTTRGGRGGGGCSLSMYYTSSHESL